MYIAVRTSDWISCELSIDFIFKSKVRVHRAPNFCCLHGKVELLCIRLRILLFLVMQSNGPAEWWQVGQPAFASPHPKAGCGARPSPTIHGRCRCRCRCCRCCCHYRVRRTPPDPNNSSSESRPRRCTQEDSRSVHTSSSPRRSPPPCRHRRLSPLYCIRSKVGQVNFVSFPNLLT